MSEYKLKIGKIGRGVIGEYKKAEEKFTDKFLEKDENSESGYKVKTGKTGEAVTNAFKNIEKSTVDGYKKIEDGVVNGYKKIENTFVDAFLVKDGEDEENNKKDIE